MSAVSAARSDCRCAGGLRRARLVRATANALRSFDRACVRHNALATAFVPAPALIAQAKAGYQHRAKRYAALESALAAETGLPTASVFNALARSLPFLPACLLIAGLQLPPAPAARRFPRPLRRAPLVLPDGPVPYTPTCAGMGLPWPGHSALRAA